MKKRVILFSSLTLRETKYEEELFGDKMFF